MWRDSNAHVERFIRTVKDEGLKRRPPKESIIHKQLKNFTQHYNTKRLHLGINCQTPSEYVAKVGG